MSKLNSHCNICGKIHLNVCQHYNRGKNPYVALVFESPRSEEEKNGMPIYGETGAYFEQVLGLLHKDGIFTHYFGRYDFRITNVYCSEQNRTKDPQRLSEELEDTIKRGGIIICFGNEAQDAVKEICDERQIVSTNIPCTKNKNLNDITVEKIAEDIKTQLEKERMTIPIKNL